MENLSTLQASPAASTPTRGDGRARDPGYAAYLVEGNDIGGIDVGFLVRPVASACLACRQEGKNTSSRIQPMASRSCSMIARRSCSTRSVRPNGSAFDFTVIVNHLRSLIGHRKPYRRTSRRAKRRAQAEFLGGLIQTYQGEGRRVHRDRRFQRLPGQRRLRRRDGDDSRRSGAD